MHALFVRMSVRSGSLCVSLKRFKLLYNYLSALDNINPLIATLYQKSSSNTRQVLGHSSLLLQDGLDVYDIPLVIRRLTSSEFPFSKLSCRTEDIVKASEGDELFRKRLATCDNISNVFKLLEVPDEQVTAYSAAYALQRLCQLKVGTDSDLESFIQRAVLNELCDTIINDINKLENVTLANLIKCFLKSLNFDQTFINTVYEEVERRIVDCVFTIEELCELIELIASSAQGSISLTRNVFIHLGSRYEQLNASNIKTAFLALKYKGPDFSYLLPLWMKALRKCWWFLKNDDISAIMEVLAIENFHHLPTLSCLSKWMFTNVHTVNANQMKNILGSFNHFTYSDSHLKNALYRYLKVNILFIDGILIGMIMDHCLKQRKISKEIFNTVAVRVARGLDNFCALDIFYILRPFGQLGYVPSNAFEMFQAVEDCLIRRFSEFEPHMLIELLASFAFIDRLPLNFVSRIYAPNFFLNIRSLSDKNLQQKASNYLLQLQAAVLLDGRKRLLRRATVESNKVHLDGLHFLFHMELARLICSLLPSKTYKELEIARGTPHLINFEIAIDDQQQPVLVHESGRFGLKKLAVVTVMSDHCLAGSTQLMGEHAMKMRHLRKLGYTVIEVYNKAFYSRTSEQKQDLLRKLLAPHLKLSS